MAEIKIEKRAPIWPWIVGLLLVALLVYFLFFRETTVATEVSTTGSDTIDDRTEMQDNQIEENL